MIAKKCDRCGTYYELYNMQHNVKKTNGIVFVNIDASSRYFTNTTIDLCPECMDAVRKFVEQPEKISVKEV